MDGPRRTWSYDAGGARKPIARFEMVPREKSGKERWKMTRFESESSKKPPPEPRKSDSDLQRKLEVLMEDLIPNKAAKRKEETPPASIRVRNPEPVEPARPSGDLWEDLVDKIKRRKRTQETTSSSRAEIRRDPVDPLVALVEDMVKSRKLKESEQSDASRRSGNAVSIDPELRVRQSLLDSIDKRRAMPDGDTSTPEFRVPSGNFGNNSSGNRIDSQGNGSSYDSPNLGKSYYAVSGNESSEERKASNDMDCSVSRCAGSERFDPNKSVSQSSRDFSAYRDPARKRKFSGNPSYDDPRKTVNLMDPSFKPSTISDPNPGRCQINTYCEERGTVKDTDSFPLNCSILKDPKSASIEEKKFNDMNSSFSRNLSIPKDFNPGMSYHNTSRNVFMNLDGPKSAKVYSNKDEKRVINDDNSSSSRRSKQGISLRNIIGNIPCEDRRLGNDTLSINPSTIRNPQLLKSYPKSCKQGSTNMNPSFSKDYSILKDPKPISYYNIPGNVSSEERTSNDMNSSFSRNLSFLRDPTPAVPSSNMPGNVPHEQRQTANDSTPTSFHHNIPANISYEDNRNAAPSNSSFSRDHPILQNPGMFHPKTVGTSLPEERGSTNEAPRSYLPRPAIVWSDIPVDVVRKDQTAIVGMGRASCTDTYNKPRNLGTSHGQQVPITNVTIADAQRDPSITPRDPGDAPSESPSFADLVTNLPNDKSSIFTDPNSGKTYANLDKPSYLNDTSQPLSVPVDKGKFPTKEPIVDHTKFSSGNTQDSQGSTSSFIFGCSDALPQQDSVPQSNGSSRDIVPRMESITNVHHVQGIVGEGLPKVVDYPSITQSNDSVDVGNSQNNVRSLHADPKWDYTHVPQSNASPQVDALGNACVGSFHGDPNGDYTQVPHSYAPMDVSPQMDENVGNFPHAQKNVWSLYDHQTSNYQSNAPRDILPQADVLGNAGNFNQSFHGDPQWNYTNTSQSDVPMDVSSQEEVNVGNFQYAPKNLWLPRYDQNSEYHVPQENVLESVQHTEADVESLQKFNNPNMSQSKTKFLSQDSIRSIGNCPNTQDNIRSHHRVQKWDYPNASQCSISYPENFNQTKKDNVQALNDSQISFKDLSFQEDVHRSQTRKMYGVQSQLTEDDRRSYHFEGSQRVNEGSQNVLENIPSRAQSGFALETSQGSFQPSQASQRSNYARSNVSLDRIRRSKTAYEQKQSMARSERVQRFCERLLSNELVHRILSSNFERCRRAPQPTKTPRRTRSLRIFKRDGFKIFKFDRVRRRVPRRTEASLDDLCRDMSQGDTANFDTFSLSSERTDDSYEPDDGADDNPGVPPERLSLVERKLRRGLDGALRDVSLLPSRTYRDDVEDDVRLKVQNLLLVIYDDLQSGRAPLLTYRRMELRNCVMEEGRLQFKKDAAMSRIISERYIAAIVYVLKVVLGLLDSGLKLSKRELYYQLKHLVRNSFEVYTAVHLICATLNVGMWSLNIFAQNGLVYGNMKLVLSRGEVINCNVPGTLIPMDVDDVVEIHTKAAFILVVEKAAIFHKLIDEGLPVKLTRPFVLITGKGYPDISTQRFLRKLWTVMAVPVFVLVDADPHGIAIMMNYRFGSVNNAHISHHLAVPNARWLGVFPSEISKYKATAQRLTSAEGRLVERMLSYPSLADHPRLLSELTLLRKTRTKAGIEGLLKSDVFLSEVYLPTKFYSRDFVQDR